MIIEQKTLAKIAKMSKNKKGNINQKRTHTFLEESFGMTYTPPRPAFGSKGVDVFGCFDHVCVATKNVVIERETKEGIFLLREIRAGETIYVQTKSNKGYFSSRTAIREFIGATGCKAHIMQVAWIDLQEKPYLEVVTRGMNWETYFVKFNIRE